MLQSWTNFDFTSRLRLGPEENTRGYVNVLAFKFVFFCLAFMRVRSGEDGHGVPVLEDGIAGSAVERQLTRV